MRNLSVSLFLDPVHLPIFFYIIVPYANEKHTFAFYCVANTTRYVRGGRPFSVKKDNLLYYNEYGPPAVNKII